MWFFGPRGSPALRPTRIRKCLQGGDWAGSWVLEGQTSPAGRAPTVPAPRGWQGTYSPTALCPPSQRLILHDLFSPLLLGTHLTPALSPSFPRSCGLTGSVISLLVGTLGLFVLQALGPRPTLAPDLCVDFLSPSPLSLPYRRPHPVHLLSPGNAFAFLSLHFTCLPGLSNCAQLLCSLLS